MSYTERTAANTVLTHRIDSKPYTRDGSVVRRRYTALERSNPSTHLGSLSVLLMRGQSFVDVAAFEVTKPGHGTGKMILRSTIRHLQSENYTTLNSISISAAALYTRRSVLGEDMDFFDPVLDRSVVCNFGEAIRQAKRADSDKLAGIPQLERHIAYGVVLDLQSVDTYGWELPIDHHQYLATQNMIQAA